MKTFVFFVILLGASTASSQLAQAIYYRSALLPTYALGFKTKVVANSPRLVMLYDVDLDGMDDIINFFGTGIVYGCSTRSGTLLTYGSSDVIDYTWMAKSNQTMASYVTDVNGNEVMVSLTWQFLSSGLHSGSCVMQNMTNRPSTVVIDPLPKTDAVGIVDQLGSAICDIDNDGWHDYVSEGAYIIYGPVDTNLVWLATNRVDGTNGVYINGAYSPVYRLGDVNGDGREDLLTSAGILLGRTNKFPFAQATATQVFNGTDGWALALTGDKQTALGDFNGDGLADFAQRDGRTPEWDRRVMVVFGSRTSLQGLSDVDGTNGILLGKVNEFNIENEYFATAMAGCGDVNADGYADIIIGNGFLNWATFNYPLRAFVVYGRPVWPGRELVLTSAWFNAINGFIVQDGPNAYVPGPKSGFGSVLGGKGDFNGDGYDDPLIGAPWTMFVASASNELYVFFGGESPAWPPGLVMPARVVDSTTGVWQYTSETNALVVGMKATNAAMYAWVNDTRAPQWDAGFGTRYFTNAVAFGTNETLTASYSCSNALGWSANRTVLIITPVPEPCALLVYLVIMAVGQRRDWHDGK